MLLLAVAVVGAACGAGAALRAGTVGAKQDGLATWYSPKLAGRKTASGEPYDPRAMTAAHRHIPFGTWIRVTRTDDARDDSGGAGNGGAGTSRPRSVVLRVNDRGPYGSGRIVDVSQAAAERLGMIRAGVVPVVLEIVDAP